MENVWHLTFVNAIMDGKESIVLRQSVSRHVFMVLPLNLTFVNVMMGGKVEHVISHFALMDVDKDIAKMLLHVNVNQAGIVPIQQSNATLNSALKKMRCAKTVSKCH